MTTAEGIKTLAACRAGMYRLMQCLFSKEPSNELIDRLKSAEAADVFFVYTGMRPDFTIFDAEAMRHEYTPLFIGPASLPALPWESVYKTGNRVLFQKSTLEVRYFYRKYGFIPAGYPNEADDHLALELDFMALMADETSRLLDNGEDPALLLEAQRDFLLKHLNWVHVYASDIDETRFPLYGRLARLLANLIDADKDLINEIRYL